MIRILEIRSYVLKPGTRDEFHRLVRDVSIPMVVGAGIDVVRYGPSLHSPDGYYLMRSFASLAEHQRQEDAFYASEAWRLGPREAIVALIEQYSDVVIELDAAAIDAMRD